MSPVGDASNLCARACARFSLSLSLSLSVRLCLYLCLSTSIPAPLSLPLPLPLYLSISPPLSLSYADIVFFWIMVHIQSKGWTRATIPLLSKRGINGISFGSGTPPGKPDVPPLFLWKDLPSGNAALQHSSTAALEKYPTWGGGRGVGGVLAPSLLTPFAIPRRHIRANSRRTRHWKH